MSTTLFNKLQRLYSRLQQQAVTLTPLCDFIVSDNNGRRFWGCPETNSICGFIGWYEEPMFAHSKAIIPGLLRKINKLQKVVEDIKEQATKHERAVEKIKEQATMLKYYLVYSWIFFAVVSVFML
ncbi:unnamed protein product [Lactuca virosa]|uniref:Zinc finger GRF-type domain-containing protein n=1 Tax=Lactuca virosa TaxID=75947 RepID=A0AAU9N3G4_9ASTR|nr:unnamed protein product [Lactuca virosa]